MILFVAVFLAGWNGPGGAGRDRGDSGVPGRGIRFRCPVGGYGRRRRRRRRIVSPLVKDPALPTSTSGRGINEARGDGVGGRRRVDSSREVWGRLIHILGVGSRFFHTVSGRGKAHACQARSFRGRDPVCRPVLLQWMFGRGCSARGCSARGFHGLQTGCSFSMGHGRYLCGFPKCFYEDVFDLGPEPYLLILSLRFRHSTCALEMPSMNELGSASHPP